LFSNKRVFEQTCFQTNLFSNKLVFKQTCFQTNLFSNKLVFKQTCFQTNLYSNKLVFKQTCFQTNLFSNKLVFKQTCFQINLFSNKQGLEHHTINLHMSEVPRLVSFYIHTFICRMCLMLSRIVPWWKSLYVPKCKIEAKSCFQFQKDCFQRLRRNSQVIF
jgi:hypothetical protein